MLRCRFSEFDRYLFLFVLGLGCGDDRDEPTVALTVDVTCGRGTVLDVVSGERVRREHAPGTQLTLRAESDEGFVFRDWGGDCSGASECTVTLDDDMTVEVAFSPDVSAPFIPPFFDAGADVGARDLALGPNGERAVELYVGMAGAEIEGSTYRYRDRLVAVYDVEGSLRWIRALEPKILGFEWVGENLLFALERVSAADFDFDGVLVTGARGILFAELSGATGKALRVHHVSPESEEKTDLTNYELHAMVSPSGYITVLGLFGGTVDLGAGPFEAEAGVENYYVALFDNAFELQWTEVFTTDDELGLLRFAVGSNGQLAMTGLSRGSFVAFGHSVEVGEEELPFLVTRDLDGSGFAISPTGTGSGFGSGVHIGPDGDFFWMLKVSGELSIGSHVFDRSVWVVRIAANGELGWREPFPVGTHGSTAGWGLRGSDDAVFASRDGVETFEIRAFAQGDGELLWERYVGCPGTDVFAAAEPSPASDEVCFVASARHSLDLGGDAVVSLSEEKDQLVFGCMTP